MNKVNENLKSILPEPPGGYRFTLVRSKYLSSLMYLRLEKKNWLGLWNSCGSVPVVPTRDTKAFEQSLRRDAQELLDRILNEPKLSNDYLGSTK